MNPCPEPYLLFKVAEVFDLGGAGIVVLGAPAELALISKCRTGDFVSIKRPDGTSKTEEIKLESLTPRSSDLVSINLPAANKADVPIGSEIWWTPKQNTSVRQATVQSQL